MESAPGPAWFADPTGRHRYRWWDGARWQPHVWDPPGSSVDQLNSSRRVTCGVAAAVAGVIVLRLAVPLLGNGERSRSAFTHRDGSTVVITAVCPGERLRSLTIYALDAKGTPTSVVWRIEGNTPLFDEVVVGVAPLGAESQGPSAATSDPTAIAVGLETTQLGRDDYVRDLTDHEPDGAVVGDLGTYRDAAEFRDEAFAHMPCDDPYGDRRVPMGAAGLAAGLSLAAVSTVVLRTRRRCPPPSRS